MKFLNRQTLKYTFERVGNKYSESVIGNYWYFILYTLRVAVFYFLMRGNNIPNFLFYVAVGNFFYEIFKSFCTQCIDFNKKRNKIQFEWDIRKYYLLHEGIIACFYLPTLIISALICKINIFKFFFFFSIGSLIFVFWLYHIAAILAFISEKNSELKIIIKIGLTYLLFLTPIFWSIEHSPSKVKTLLGSLNPLAYMMDVPRYAIMPIKPDRLIILCAIIILTYIIAKFLKWQDNSAKEGGVL